MRLTFPCRFHCTWHGAENRSAADHAGRHLRKHTICHSTYRDTDQGMDLAFFGNSTSYLLEAGQSQVSGLPGWEAAPWELLFLLPWTHAPLQKMRMTSRETARPTALNSHWYKNSKVQWDRTMTHHKENVAKMGKGIHTGYHELNNQNKNQTKKPHLSRKDTKQIHDTSTIIVKIQRHQISACTL